MNKQKHISLEQAFGFRRQDLEANRSGRMSDAQKTQLKERFTAGYRLYALIAIHSIILLIGVAVMGWSQRGDSVYFSETGIALALTLLVTALTIAVCIGLVWRHQQTIGQETQQGAIEKVSGAVHVEPSKRLAAHLQVGDHEFKLAPQQAAAFDAGAIYDVYISPRTQQILSAEQQSS